MIAFENGSFIASALTPVEFPNLKTDQGNVFPEVALIGRSNVGKSTLVNALLRSKTLAKTSSTPGKTQRILFFSIDKQLLLVDLPGYGYSKAAKREVSLWSQSIETYLSQRPSLKLLLLLIDSRRGFAEEDLAMLQWAHSKTMHLAVIFTKCDKLPPSQQANILNAHKTHLPDGIDAIAVSTADPTSRKRLIQFINQRLA